MHNNSQHEINKGQDHNEVMLFPFLSSVIRITIQAFPNTLIVPQSITSTRAAIKIIIHFHNLSFVYPM
jgi:hypothetical protein